VDEVLERAMDGLIMPEVIHRLFRVWQGRNLGDSNELDLPNEFVREPTNL
jgi:hypothetical protein